MKKMFMNKDFLLRTDTAQELYHTFAEEQPIFDFHNHLSAQEIYENKSLGNLANAWLDHDHYKWRAMRAAGVDERLITGHLNPDGSVKKTDDDFDYERYLAFVKTLQGAIGNPLYHWSHLELQRYFGVNEHLTEENARDVWLRCNALLDMKEFYPRELIKKMNVKCLCTTDDPLDLLEYHKKLASEWKDVDVLPSFRPDVILAPDSAVYKEYIQNLQTVTEQKISTVSDLIKAVAVRLEYFKQAGSVVTDHSLENDFYIPGTFDEVNFIFSKACLGKKLTHDEISKYKGYVLIELGKLYAEKGFVMQIHIGAIRDNNSALLASCGKNIGEDSLHDFNYAYQIGAVLNGIYSSAPNAKTILYNLNPKDNEALATMAANFRNCQFGPAWWFNDHKNGIEEQIKVYSRTSVLSSYIGMLTDSRSFLSFPRHEYFRRILCNYIGDLVENGEYPDDEKLLGEIVKNISYKNSIEFIKI